jgi:hypothetical protein
MKVIVARKVRVSVKRFLKEAKSIFSKIAGFIARIILVKKLRLIAILFWLFILAGYLFIWVLSPDSKSVQAPVQTA